MHCTSHMGKRLLLLLLSIGCCLAGFAAESYTLRGRVIDRLTRRPVAYAAVVLDGQGDKGASTDSTGRFAIERVRPGIYRLAASDGIPAFKVGGSWRFRKSDVDAWIASQTSPAEGRQA